MPEKTSYHRRGESRVLGAIKDGRDHYDIVGREDDSVVAEAMAYAAKPLIDEALADLEGTPNSLAVLTHTGEDGKTVSGLSDLPKVVIKNGAKRSYKDIERTVGRAHRAANEVQVGYYQQLDEARRLHKQADAVEAAAKDEL